MPWDLGYLSVCILKGNGCLRVGLTTRLQFGSDLHYELGLTLKSELRVSHLSMVIGRPIGRVLSDQIVTINLTYRLNLGLDI